MTDNAFALMLGAFITSSGLASIVAGFAVYFTWKAAKTQIVETRLQSETNDKRQRWWEAIQWFHTHRVDIGEQLFRAGIEQLTHKDLVETDAQRAILRAVTNAPKPKPTQ